MTPLRKVLTFGVVAYLGACAGSSGGADAGPAVIGCDGGTPSDDNQCARGTTGPTGGAMDAGAIHDGGSDAGVFVRDGGSDAGVVRDGGSDAGLPLDGGAFEDGGMDAGPGRDGGEDGGPELDGGMRAGTGTPPRLQWNANDGYCGEVSLIVAGLYFGQYLSQYDARALASSTPQNESASQLLLGVNDTTAAAAMHLNAIEWDTGNETSTEEFLAWVKGNVVTGYPVAIGIYTNEFLFYGKTNATAGDPDYDHIVQVIDVASMDLSVPAVYSSDDVITFNDNGLWTGTSTGAPQYTFNSAMGSFQATRAQANARTGAIYSLSSDGSNYGIALTGVIDQDHETVPVRVATNLNYERPAIAAGSTTRPAPEPLVLIVTVSGLTPGVAYNLYRYNAMASVPNAAFNANASSAAETWAIQIASGSTYVLTEDIMSNEVAAYRAVPASAL